VAAHLEAARAGLDGGRLLKRVDHLRHVALGQNLLHVVERADYIDRDVAVGVLRRLLVHELVLGVALVGEVVLDLPLQLLHELLALGSRGDDQGIRLDLRLDLGLGLGLNLRRDLSHFCTDTGLPGAFKVETRESVSYFNLIV
jgi:hypothetical protein